MMKNEDLELRDKDIYPDESVLRSALGSGYGGYASLLELFENREMFHEWRYYKDGKAWLCKVQKKKRTIVWMSAWRGYMKATIYLPLRLWDGVLELGISDAAKTRFAEEKNVGKSKPCTFEVDSETDLSDLECLVDFKISEK